MAEEVLVSGPPHQSMIDAGRRLVDALDAHDFQLDSAFWILEPQETGWRLVIAAAGVLSEGLLKSYGRVLSLAPSIPGLYWPALIRVEDKMNPLVKAVRSSIRGMYPPTFVGPALVNLKSTSYDPVQLYVYRV